MRKLIMSLSAAGAALAFAAPASAQYYPYQPQGYGYNGYGYGNGYGNGYGYNSYAQVRSLQARIDMAQQRIANFQNSGMLSWRDARNLTNVSRDLEYRLARASRNGLNPAEVQDLSYRVARLEQHVSRGRYGRQWGGNYGYNNGYNGYGYNNGYYRDRDHDGRDDNDD